MRDDDIRHFAAALRQNTVSLILFASLSYCSSLYIKTLTTLDLTSNKLGPAGAEYLADALRHNNVRLVLFASLLYLSFPLHIETYYIEHWL